MRNGRLKIIVETAVTIVAVDSSALLPGPIKTPRIVNWMRN